MITFNELYIAYKDCLKNKKYTKAAIEFQVNEAENLVLLYEQLKEQLYELGPSIAFCITKPVKREVFAAEFRDRIIHHLIMNRLKPYFEQEFIDNTFSCRNGKGVLKGIQTMSKDIIQITNNFNSRARIIKLDIKAFFMSINKQLLYDKLCYMLNKYDIPDKEFICQLLKLVVFDCPQKHCIRRQRKYFWNDLPKDKSLFNKDDFTGLPIGNLTSQWFANYFLNEFDHWILEELGVKGYGRYVDDFYLIIPYSVKPNTIIKAIREKLKEYGLTLHPKKIYVQDVTKGALFIGGVVKPKRIYISNRTKGNFYSKLKEFSDYFNKNNKAYINDLEYVLSSINSYLGLFQHFNVYNIKKRMLNKDEFKSIKKWFWFKNDYKKARKRYKVC